MEESKPKPQLALTPMQARLKAEAYCAYQERSQQEVRDKLYGWGMHRNEVENIITELILDNFINEERFARAYVSGKFNMKQWGKIKIRQGLKVKGVSERMITEALNTIDAEEYLETLRLTLEKKRKLLPAQDSYKLKMKLANFAAGRGFESNLIFDILNYKDL